MKNRGLIIKIILYLFPILILLGIGAYVGLTSKIDNISRQKSREIIDKMVVLPEWDYNEEKINKTLNTISNIKPYIIKKLQDKDVKIKFAKDGKDPVFKDKIVENKVAAGFYNYRDRVIYYRLDTMSDSLPRVEYHEIGHAVDFVLLEQISGSQEFIDIWSKEAKRLTTLDYYNSSSQEYFAYSFTLYTLDRTLESKEKFKKLAPLTYEFMENIINSLKE